MLQFHVCTTRTGFSAFWTRPRIYVDYSVESTTRNLRHTLWSPHMAPLHWVHLMLRPTHSSCTSHAIKQFSSLMTYALFWDITPHIVVIRYGHYGSETGSACVYSGTTHSCQLPYGNSLHLWFCVYTSTDDTPRFVHPNYYSSVTYCLSVIRTVHTSHSGASDSMTNRHCSMFPQANNIKIQHLL